MRPLKSGFIHVTSSLKFIIGAHSGRTSGWIRFRFMLVSPFPGVTHLGVCGVCVIMLSVSFLDNEGGPRRPPHGLVSELTSCSVGGLCPSLEGRRLWKAPPSL